MFWKFYQKTVVFYWRNIKNKIIPLIGEHVAPSSTLDVIKCQHRKYQDKLFWKLHFNNLLFLSIYIRTPSDVEVYPELHSILIWSFGIIFWQADQFMFQSNTLTLYSVSFPTNFFSAFSLVSSHTTNLAISGS